MAYDGERADVAALDQLETVLRHVMDELTTWHTRALKAEGDRGAPSSGAGARGTELEQELFERLISVSGIGPKVALAVLSGIEPEELTRAIQRSDLARLTAIPGVGKKTSERIVLELRDKLEGIGATLTAAPQKAAPLSAVENDVLSALLNLGCARPAAEAAVRKAKADGVAVDFEPLFRRALELLR